MRCIKYYGGALEQCIAWICTIHKYMYINMRICITNCYAIAFRSTFQLYSHFSPIFHLLSLSLASHSRCSPGAYFPTDFSYLLFMLVSAFPFIVILRSSNKSIQIHSLWLVIARALWQSPNFKTGLISALPQFAFQALRFCIYFLINDSFSQLIIP